jgi:hypothetical protein
MESFLIGFSPICPISCSTGWTTVSLDWISYLVLGSAEIGFHHSVFLVPAAIFGSVRSMRTPMILAQLAGPLKTDFLGSLLRGYSTGPLGSCLVLVRSFLTELCMGFLGGTHALNSLKRSLKRMNVHGGHALFLQVVLILPLVQTLSENVTTRSA